MPEEVSKAIEASSKLADKLPKSVQPAAISAIICALLVFILGALIAILARTPDHRAVEIFIWCLVSVAGLLLIGLVIFVALWLFGVIRHPFKPS